MPVSHEIPAAKLAELLASLPEGYRVVPNQVENLAILDQDSEYVGYVDLGQQEVQILEVNQYS